MSASCLSYKAACRLACKKLLTGGVLGARNKPVEEMGLLEVVEEEEEDIRRNRIKKKRFSHSQKFREP